LRDHAVKDVGVILDWVDRHTKLDGGRVGIHGASYGGFMALASLVAHGDRLRAGSSLVGISNLVTFLENTASHRRPLRRAEYGDERDPETRRYLTSISPLTHASSIRTPLFVAHGARDPRVPAREAEQIAHAAAESGAEVWYMLAHREGHLLRQRRTRDTFYRLLATFVEKHLLGSVPSSESESVPDESVPAASVPDESAPAEAVPAEPPMSTPAFDGP
jgi:dipeptidyl aminopeptidase/acylaminoacyl peptidase